MKIKFNMLLVALAFSLSFGGVANAAGNGSSPKGKPFMALADRIDALAGEVYANSATIEDTLVGLNDRVASLEVTVSALQTNVDNGLSDLQDSLDQAISDLALLQGLVADIENQLLLKQNIVTGTCTATGEALIQVNEDGSVVCGNVGAATSGSLISYRVFNYIYIPTETYGSLIQECPTGTTLSGGGFSGGYEIDINSNYQYGSSSNSYSSGWIVSGYNTSSYGRWLYSIATCMKIAS